MQSHKIVKQETRTVIYTVSQKTKLMSDATASMYIKAILTIFLQKCAERIRYQMVVYIPTLPN